ncbi:MAG: hypothetical protein KAJ51_14605, partial [Thermoplasmata archaeon]|nr:hypothetical protein [Thermoplasmata archaeon]
LIIAVILGALIGGFLGRSLMYGMISFLTALTISGVVLSLTGDGLVTLIAFFVTLIKMWFIVEKFLAVLTAFLGAALVGYSLMLLSGSGFIGLVIFLIVTGLLTVVGARYQLQNS